MSKDQVTRAELIDILAAMEHCYFLWTSWYDGSGKFEQNSKIFPTTKRKAIASRCCDTFPFSKNGSPPDVLKVLA